MSQTSRTLPRPLGQPAERGRRRVFRKARRKDPDFWTVVGLRVLLVAIFCGLWQLAPDGVVPESAVGRPSSVASSFWSLLKSGALPTALGSTLLSVVYAMIIGAVLGIALGIFSSMPVGRWLLGPAISLLYAIPKVGLIAVFVILLGVERSSHVALVVSAVLFVYFYAIRQGIEEVNEDQLNALRGMGAGPLTVLRKLILPSAIPQLLGATRIALPLALTSEIFAELREPSIPGLGTLLADSSQSLNGAAASAVLIVTVLIAYGLDIVLNSRVKGFTELTGTGLQV
jgi:ABC-type nitrate/sulfonate/bicarbonate transport system permease component